MGIFDFATKILGVKGAIDTVKEGTKSSFKNLGKIAKPIKNEESNNIDFDEFYNKTLNGRLRFRQRMINEGVNEIRYNRLNQKQYNYSIVVALFSLLFLSYSFFMIFNGNALIALIAILMILIIYADTMRKASEIREQSFITFKEFILSPNLWFPTTKRKNEYFNIDNEEQVNEILNEIDKLDEEENN